MSSVEPTPETLEQRLTEAMPRLHAHLRGRTAEPDDVAQEVVVRALRYSASFDDTRPLWPWLRRVVDRVLQDQWQADERRPVAAADLNPATVETPLLAAEGRDLEALLAQLRPVERKVLLRFHQGGETVVEIAAALDLPQGTVKSHLSRARRRLAGLPPDHQAPR